MSIVGQICYASGRPHSVHHDPNVATEAHRSDAMRLAGPSAFFRTAHRAHGNHALYIALV